MPQQPLSLVPTEADDREQTRRLQRRIDAVQRAKQWRLRAIRLRHRAEERYHRALHELALELSR